jgi:hypothetical protein
VGFCFGKSDRYGCLFLYKQTMSQTFTLILLFK